MVKLSLNCTLAKLKFMDLGVFVGGLDAFVGVCGWTRCVKMLHCCIVLNLSLN